MATMNEAELQNYRISDWQQLLTNLYTKVQSWIANRDCAVRLVDKTYEFNGSGRTKIQAMLIQEDAIKMILDPIDWDPVKKEALVDLYIMPQYDSGARFFFGLNDWRIYWVNPQILPVSEFQKTDEETLLNKENFNTLLDGLKQNAVSL